MGWTHLESEKKSQNPKQNPHQSEVCLKYFRYSTSSIKLQSIMLANPLWNETQKMAINTCVPSTVS